MSLPLKGLAASLAAGLIFIQPVSAHVQLPQLHSVKRSATQLIPSRQVELTQAERDAGVVSFNALIPTLEVVNERFNVFKGAQFQHFIHNFHYPYRSRFQLKKQTPPAHVVLHWTANSRPDIPLYTFSAFLRRRSYGRIVERPHHYKNVSNYFLSGPLDGPEGKEAYLVKLTRGDIRSWGDIPRVTAFPIRGAHDDNKYDGRGALGIEIDSPDFRTFYRSSEQRDKLHNFLLLVLRERNLLGDFQSLRRSRHWRDMLSLHRFLKKNLDRIDVNARGTIPTKYRHLDALLKDFPDLDKGVYQEARRIFKFISGHGIVAREYNERMRRQGRPRQANYHKIDFTEAHVFVVAMDLLQSDFQFRGGQAFEYDLATQRLIEAHKRQPRALREPEPETSAQPVRYAPSGRRQKP